jgi:ATP-binding cassette subfamily F protein 3
VANEKSRLTLARIIYAAPQLLALDEPTNHLDIDSREALENALAEYPGTIIFVTHDRYLVQKVATHLIYLEGQQAFLFDRLSAFEEWMKQGPVTAAQPAVSPVSPDPSKPLPAMSKNKRDRIEKEIAGLEKRIESAEQELGQLEAGFQNPEPAADWEAAHRRYAELQEHLKTLYDELVRHWEMMNQVR